VNCGFHFTQPHIANIFFVDVLLYFPTPIHFLSNLILAFSKSSHLIFTHLHNAINILSKGIFISFPRSLSNITSSFHSALNAVVFFSILIHLLINIFSNSSEASHSSLGIKLIFL